jgi:single-strand DNA-binding protein
MIRASIHGRLGGDPVQRKTRAGKPMATVSVAVDVAKPGDEPATEWISLVAFGKAAEALAQHRKGDVVSAMGVMTRSTFAGRDGNEKVSWSLLAESLLSARTVYGDDASQPYSENRNKPLRRPRHAYPRHKLARDPVPDLPNDSVDDLYADIIP